MTRAGLGTYVDRHNNIHLPAIEGYRLARAFASREPEGVIRYIAEVEDRLTAEGMIPGERWHQEYLRKQAPAMALARNWAGHETEGNRQEETEYHAVVSFGRLAEVCALYCTRGRRVYVEGKLRTRDYTGSDGLRRFSTEVVAESVKLLTARRPSEDLATEEPEEISRAALPVAS